MAEIRFSERVNAIKASPTAAAAARARALKAEGWPIISLTTGEPDFDTPAPIIDASVAAMRAGETRYTNPGGTPALKAAVRAKFKRDNGLIFEDDEIITCAGAKQAVATALMTLVQDACEVLIPVPAWVSYVDMCRLTGATPVLISCTAEHGFKVSADRLAAAITPKTAALILNSPSNPTGAIYSAKELAALGAVLEQHPQITIISDDIYEHLRYDGEPYVTLAQVCPSLKDRTLTVNGVSKAFAMTGWRIGFAGGPKSLIRAMTKYQSQASGAPSSVAQAAAAFALVNSSADVEEMRQAFARRRDMLVPLVNATPGLHTAAPDGAFYLFISVSGLLGRKTPDGAVLESEGDVVTLFLEQANVATVGGDAFGLSPYIRISFAAAEDVLREAFERIGRVIDGLA